MDDWFGVSGGANFSNIGEAISLLLLPIFTLAGMIALLFVMWGGLRYMLSRGDPKAAEAARGTLTSAIIGLLIVLFSAAIFVIFADILRIDIFVGAVPTAQAAVSIGDTVRLGGGLRIGFFQNIGQVFSGFVLLALAAAALIFLGMMIWGGIRYLNAGGNPENAESARSTLTSAGIGLLIIVAAFLIIELATNVIGLASIFN
ncbi:MAG: hypothetical protein WD187_03745 [Candidatus Woykebacteria bacterium]